MYNIIQLNDKELSELQSIAKELGIKNADSLKKDQLVYDILDEQAVRNAAKKSSATNEGQSRKRSRISVKKEGDKVYTATKDKAVKLEANTPEIPAKVNPFAEQPAKENQVVSCTRIHAVTVTSRVLTVRSTPTTSTTCFLKTPSRV